MKKVTVYGTPECMFCNALKEWLDGEGIKYDAVDVSDPRNVATAEKTLGHPLVTIPVSLVGDTEIEGFDRPAFKKLLKNG